MSQRIDAKRKKELEGVGGKWMNVYSFCDKNCNKNCDQVTDLYIPELPVSHKQNAYETKEILKKIHTSQPKTSENLDEKLRKPRRYIHRTCSLSFNRSIVSSKASSHSVRSSASSFNFQCPLLSLRFSTICLSLLPRLLFPSICPSIFHSIGCLRKPFSTKEATNRISSPSLYSM